jgi:alpha-ketoglutarate-dependent taurine dioxygenase
LFTSNASDATPAQRARAFEEFKKVALKEQANGTETLQLFRLARVFSTASTEETSQMLIVMRYWSRAGDRDALMQYGTELYHGGYDGELYEDSGPLHWVMANDGRYPLP